MDRIVHFDLKGSPWKLPYFKKVLCMIKEWGATGVLLEWEDTFPYVGDIAIIGSEHGSSGEGMYSLDEVNHIISYSKDLGLEVIQLVQTIGHLEFVLKHPQYKALREKVFSPEVLCPSNPESMVVIKKMVDQALDVQPDAKYFHIGADEVWHCAECEQCRARSGAHRHGHASLYLNHIRDLTMYIKGKRPDLTLLMWDDMLRPIDYDVLNTYNLGELVQPVCWDYNITRYFNISPNLWHKYSLLFPRVWAASAFKGASGSSQMLPDVERYRSNHDAWMREIGQYKNNVHFVGIILTGWSRYSHFATLCELLPVSMNSLATCLKILQTTSVGNPSITSEQWPAVELASNIHAFHKLRLSCNAFLLSEQISTYLNPWQVACSYTTPTQIAGLLQESQGFLDCLLSLSEQIKLQLRDITGERSTQEWIGTNMLPIIDQIKDINNKAKDKISCHPSVAPVMFQ